MNILDLSAYVLREYGAQSRDGISPMKLQKLLYYAKAWGLVVGRDLVRGEFEAWTYGPVNREVYFQYSPHGAGAIPAPLFAPTLSDPDRDFLDRVLASYLPMSAAELSDRTHREDPWRHTPKDARIDPALMREYYSRQPFADVLRGDSGFRAIPSDTGHAFTMDMDVQDAREVTTYPSFEDYKATKDLSAKEFQKLLEDLF